MTTDQKAARPDIAKAIQIIKANISGHGLDIWKLRDAEKVLLEAYEQLKNELEKVKK